MQAIHKLSFLYLVIVLFIVSCSKEEEILPNPTNESGLDTYDLQVIGYFKEVALGFEFGTASEVTRKWKTQMNVFIGGDPSPALTAELDRIIGELDTLITDGFKITIVTDTLQSNYYLYFGSGDNYAKIFPSQAGYVGSNWGLFSVWFNGSNEITNATMYVDTYRADLVAQKHLLREEFTQSMGMAKDSYQYQASIFQQAWTTTNEYAEIDRDVIRLLYHPKMGVGLNAAQVDPVLKEIILSGK